MSDPTTPARWHNDGTTQDRRFPDALDPSSFEIDDRTPAEILRLFAHMAHDLRLDANGGDWGALFPPLPEGVTAKQRATYWQLVLDELQARQDNPPHLALCLTFVQLFRHAQEHLNELTQAHLDHWYRHTLGFVQRPAQPDHVYVFPELAKNVPHHTLDAGTLLDAGQDLDGVARVYRTDAAVSVSRARVAEVRIHTNTNNDKSPWATLGANQLLALDAVKKNAPVDHLSLGFAISSKSLLLEEGGRTITLVLSGTKLDEFKSIEWKCYLSAAGTWLEKPVTKCTNGVTVTLDASEPALVAPDTKQHHGAPASEWPLLLLYPPANVNREHYKSCVGDLKLDNIKVEAELKASLELSNQLGPIDGSHPFQPFGPRPEIESWFAFDCDELRRQNLISCALTFEWTGGVPKNTDLIDYASSTPPKLPKLPLAKRDPTLFKVQSNFDNWSEADKEANKTLPLLTLFTTKLTIPGRATKLTLKEPHGAFGHERYPTVVSNLAFDNAKLLKGDTSTPPPPLPSPPYTPTLSSFSLTYVALSGDSADSFQQFHLQPLGCAVETKHGPSGSLLPTYPVAPSLYIGIADLAPTEKIRLYFADLEASGDAIAVDPVSRSAAESPAVEWSHLCSRRGWVPFEYGAVEGERPLLQPGVVSFDFRQSDDTADPAPTTDLQWIRATVKKVSHDDLCQLSAICAQPVRASLELGETPPTHLRDGSRDRLPPPSVNCLAQPEPNIVKLDQPFRSFGGRSAESTRDLYTRASERLRHRNRAMTTWDYERLVLNEFPEIYKALCVRSTETAGTVRIVVVPHSRLHSDPQGDDTRGRPKVDPRRLQPRMRPGLRPLIEEFLRAHASGMVVISVANPEYVQLKVRCTVVFQPGQPAADLVGRLNDDLMRYLSPWAFVAGNDPVFGGRIHQSVIQNFIINRDYVTHFKDFALWQGPSETAAKTQEAEATTAQILVSASTHDISPTKT